MYINLNLPHLASKPAQMSECFLLSGNTVKLSENICQKFNCQRLHIPGNIMKTEFLFQMEDDLIFFSLGNLGS